jgi:pimeloyl-ACP methyl ester carboxylesterase
MEGIEMATFVLVHGAHHGGWCWYKVAALLEGLGHCVHAPDLPGHGRNAATAATMQGYVDHVTTLVDASPEPVILVGHSMGGAVITGAGEARPEKIARIVYLTAFMARSGASMAGALSASAGPDGIVAVRDASQVLYHDCPAEDAMLARLCLTPQAVEPLVAPVHWTAHRWGSIPRTYIGCGGDRVFAISEQRKRAAVHPGSEWIELEAGHSPFFSMPAVLADHLAGLAA